VSPGGLIPYLWLGWLLYWTVAAGGVKRTRWRQQFAAAAIHVVPLACAILLLAAPYRFFPELLSDRFLPRSRSVAWLATVFVAAGLGAAIWARVHLGRNWSGTITLKEDHTLIESGPYRVVRHPIYSGLLLAFAGTALAVGEWRGLVAVALALFAFLHRIRIEEERMRATFPQYETYRRRTRALLPFLY